MWQFFPSRPLAATRQCTVAMERLGACLAQTAILIEIRQGLQFTQQSTIVGKILKTRTLIAN